MESDALVWWMGSSGDVRYRTDTASPDADNCHSTEPLQASHHALRPARLYPESHTSRR